jgi:hypothetical protein
MRGRTARSTHRGLVLSESGTLKGAHEPTPERIMVGRFDRRHVRSGFALAPDYLAADVAYGTGPCAGTRPLLVRRLLQGAR